MGPRRQMAVCRLAVCGTALLTVIGCAISGAGLFLLVRSPPECDGLPAPGGGEAGNTSSRRMLHEPEIAFGAAVGYAAPLISAPTKAAVLTAANAVAALARAPGGPGLTWAASHQAPAAAKVLRSPPPETSSQRRGDVPASGARRQLSCAPTECVDLVTVGAGMSAAHQVWIQTGDVGVDALIAALTTWHPLLDIGGSNSAIQSLSWAEFESTARQVKLIMDGYYASGAVPAGRPPRAQVGPPHCPDPAAAQISASRPSCIGHVRPSLPNSRPPRHAPPSLRPCAPPPFAPLPHARPVPCPSPPCLPPLNLSRSYLSLAGPPPADPGRHGCCRRLPLGPSARLLGAQPPADGRAHRCGHGRAAGARGQLGVAARLDWVRAHAGEAQDVRDMLGVDRQAKQAGQGQGFREGRRKGVRWALRLVSINCVLMQVRRRRETEASGWVGRFEAG
jgi:hypothetical protein